MAKENLRQELHDALRKTREELDRAEILAAALCAFSKPVPDYEPRFQHFGPAGAALGRFEIEN